MKQIKRKLIINSASVHQTTITHPDFPVRCNGDYLLVIVWGDFMTNKMCLKVRKHEREQREEGEDFHVKNFFLFLLEILWKLLG